MNRRGPNFIVHADDYGLSRGVTDSILECVDNGPVRSISVLANGHAFDYAMSEFKKREGLRLSVHLNLCEGPPLLPAKSVDLLTGGDGEFNMGFVSLWKKHLLSGRRVKERLEAQVRAEFSAQISRVAEGLGEGYEIRIDSHRHYHMIPFVFRSLLEVAKSFPGLRYIRLPYEPSLEKLSERMTLGLALPAGLLKRRLLNRLSLRSRPLLESRGILTNDIFIGTLFSGHMSESIVKLIVKRLRDGEFNAPTVELLFHPGGAVAGEEDYWRSRQDLIKYYYSPWREREKKALTGAMLKGIFSERTGKK